MDNIKLALYENPQSLPIIKKKYITHELIHDLILKNYHTYLFVPCDEKNGCFYRCMCMYDKTCICKIKCMVCYHTIFFNLMKDIIDELSQDEKKTFFFRMIDYKIFLLFEYYPGVKDDIDIMTHAIKTDGMMIKYMYCYFHAWNSSHGDQHTLEDIAIKSNIRSIQYTSLRHNKEIMMKAIQQDPSISRYLIGPLKYDREIEALSISLDIKNVKYFPNACENMDIMVKAIKECPYLIRYVDYRIRCSEEFIEQIMDIDFKDQSFYDYFISAAFLSIRISDNLLKRMVSKYGRLLILGNNRQVNTISIVKNALKNDGTALEFVGDYLNNKEFIVDIAIRQDKQNIKFIGKKLRKKKKYLDIC